MARRVFSSPRWESARVKRARMRERAANHLLERGFSRLTAGGLTRATGGNLQALYIYPNLDALLADIVRLHQEKLADHITEVVLAASPLSGEARVEALAAGLLEALSAEHDEHVVTTMILAGMPAIAQKQRNFDCWLHGVLADAIGGEPDERAMLARSMLTLITDWSVRLDASDTASRALCARVLTRMVSAARAPSPYPLPQGEGGLPTCPPSCGSE